MILHKHTPKRNGDKTGDLIASKLQSDRLPPTHCTTEKCPPSKTAELNFKMAKNIGVTTVRLVPWFYRNFLMSSRDLPKRKWISWL